MNRQTSIYDATAAADLAQMTAARGMMEAGAFFHQNRWCYGTSGNFSVVLSRDPLRMLITASGRDKGRLAPGDFILVDDTGRPVDPSPLKPSAESLLHVVASVEAGAGAVLHTHSVWATVLSEHYGDQKGFKIEGLEMLKGFDGIETHETSKWIEIFANTQRIPDLASQVRNRLREMPNPLRHGYLIRGHGLYTWGRDLEEARRHVEIFEFLLEVVGRKLSLQGR